MQRVHGSSTGYIASALCYVVAGALPPAFSFLVILPPSEPSGLDSEILSCSKKPGIQKVGAFEA
jgi:hypothetical protein